MSVVFRVGLSTLVLDQIRKAVVTRRLDLSRPAGARRWIRLRCVRHRGGLLGPGGRSAAWVCLWGGIVAAVLLLVAVHPSLQGSVPRVSLGAALGGTTGNLLDRLCRGAVIDFIDLSRWPTFNLADAAIVGGVSIALWTALGG